MVVRRGGEGRAEEDCWHRKKSLALQADSGHPQESQPGGSRSRAAGEHSAEEISGAGQHHFLLSCRAGSGGVLPSQPDPRPGSLVHRQELWAGSQKPWVLILVLQCGCASVNHSCQNGGKGCPGFLPVRSRNGRMHGERKKKKKEKKITLLVPEGAGGSSRGTGGVCLALGSPVPHRATAYYVAQFAGDPAAGP